MECIQEVQFVSAKSSLRSVGMVVQLWTRVWLFQKCKIEIGHCTGNGTHTASLQVVAHPTLTQTSEFVLDTASQNSQGAMHRHDAEETHCLRDLQKLHNNSSSPVSHPHAEASRLSS